MSTKRILVLEMDSSDNDKNVAIMMESRKREKTIRQVVRTIGNFSSLNTNSKKVYEMVVSFCTLLSQAAVVEKKGINLLTY